MTRWAWGMMTMTWRPVHHDRTQEDEQTHVQACEAWPLCVFLNWTSRNIPLIFIYCDLRNFVIFYEKSCTKWDMELENAKHQMKILCQLNYNCCLILWKPSLSRRSVSIMAGVLKSRKNLWNLFKIFKQLFFYSHCANHTQPSPANCTSWITLFIINKEEHQTWYLSKAP